MAPRAMKRQAVSSAEQASATSRAADRPCHTQLLKVAPSTAITPSLLPAGPRAGVLAFAAGVPLNRQPSASKWPPALHTRPSRPITWMQQLTSRARRLHSTWLAAHSSNPLRTMSRPPVVPGVAGLRMRSRTLKGTALPCRSNSTLAPEERALLALAASSLLQPPVMTRCFSCF